MAASCPTIRRRRAASNSPASLLRRLGSSTAARFVLIGSSRISRKSVLSCPVFPCSALLYCRFIAVLLGLSPRFLEASEALEPTRVPLTCHRAHLESASIWPCARSLAGTQNSHIWLEL